MTVVMPDAVTVTIDYLVAALPAVGGRVAVVVPSEPVWPMLRVSALSTSTLARRRLDRALLQIDCFDTAPAPARRLAAEVRAVLTEIDGFIHPDGALAASGDDWAQRVDADDEFTPAVWRAAVTGHLILRPNP